MNASRREGLVAIIESARMEMEGLIEQVGEANLAEPGVTGEWSVKDILAHLTTWEERIVAWAEALRQGIRPAPAPWPRDWSEEQINASIYESNRDRPLADVLERWRQVHKRVIAGIQALNEDELYQQKLDWLGDGPFADAVPGNSYEHYQTHADEIRQWLAAHQSTAAG